APRVLLVRLAPGGGPPFALFPAAPARRPLGPIRGPWSGLDGSLSHRAAGARRPVGGGTRPRPIDRGVLIHVVPPGRPGDGPSTCRAHQLFRRSRLRAVGRSAVPACTLRPDRRGGETARAAPFRHAGSEAPPGGGGLRSLVATG